MGTAIGMLIAWAISLVILIFVIGAGVRVGMRWSRIDERREQEARDKLGTNNDQQSLPDFKPHRTDRRFK